MPFYRQQNSKEKWTWTTRDDVKTNTDNNNNLSVTDHSRLAYESLLQRNNCNRKYHPLSIIQPKYTIHIKMSHFAHDFTQCLYSLELQCVCHIFILQQNFDSLGFYCFFMQQFFATNSPKMSQIGLCSFLLQNFWEIHQKCHKFVWVFHNFATL